jgi:MFS family permease
MGIFPYVYNMVEDFQITTDKAEISLYAGLVTSVFTLAEFLTGFHWGRMSDRIGRKPVVLMGLSGTALSVLIFGFAPNIWVALAARAVGGFLNGSVHSPMCPPLAGRLTNPASNMGVLQTTIAEMITAKEHQRKCCS